MPSDPFVRFLEAAPIDDERVTAEEQAALAKVKADRAAGMPTMSFEEIKRRLPGAAFAPRSPRRCLCGGPQDRPW
jgi:hypothetical protein